MEISLETFATCRVALAQMMLLAPNEPKFRRAFNALRQALIDENDSTQSIIEASRQPALLRAQI
jgi:hypothetical protein